MKHDDIVYRLKTFQSREKNVYLTHGLTASFLAGINQRILEKHGQCAKCAVRKVLAEMSAVPAHPLLCLEAMLQLCRDDPLQFANWQDENLICRINMRTYFSSLTAEQMVVETQEGVV